MAWRSSSCSSCQCSVGSAPRPPQVVELGAMGVEVGAQGQHNQGRGVPGCTVCLRAGRNKQVVHEGLALGCSQRVKSSSNWSTTSRGGRRLQACQQPAHVEMQAARFLGQVVHQRGHGRDRLASRVRLAARLSRGRAVGVMTCTGQRALPSGGRLASANGWPRLQSATNPRAPATTCRCPRRPPRPAGCCVARSLPFGGKRSRPKKLSASARSKYCRPF